MDGTEPAARGSQSSAAGEAGVAATAGAEAAVWPTGQDGVVDGVNGAQADDEGQGEVQSAAKQLSRQVGKQPSR